MEAPLGFPARMLDMVAYFSSHTQWSTTGVVVVYLATAWLVEVVRGWYPDIVHRGYLLHLPPELEKGVHVVTPACLGAQDAFAVGMLRAILELHGLLKWDDLGPSLDRAKIDGSAPSTETRREFVHYTRELVGGKLSLMEGMGEMTCGTRKSITRPRPISVAASGSIHWPARHQLLALSSFRLPVVGRGRRGSGAAVGTTR